MTEIPTPPAEPAPPEPGVFALMGRFLFNPVPVFESLARRPRILAPLLVLVAVQIAASLVIYKPVIVPMQQEKMAERPDVTPEAREQVRKGMESPVGLVIAGVIGTFAAVIPALLWAAALYFVFTLMTSGKADFKGVLSVALFASLIQIPHVLVRVPLTLAKAANGDFDPAVTLGPASLMDKPDPMNFGYGVLMGLDLFSLWAWATVAIGLAVLYRRPRGRIWGPLAALFCVQLLVTGALATWGSRS